MSDKKRKKTLVQAEKELKHAMQKVIEKYKALSNAEICNCRQNYIHDEYITTQKHILHLRDCKLACIITIQGEEILEQYQHGNGLLLKDEKPTLTFYSTMKNLDNNEILEI